MRPASRSLSLATLIAVALATAACGTSKSQPPAPAAPGARVSVTADWGSTAIADGDGRPGTALDATRAVARIATSYGGRYVDAIAGEAGDGERDWVFWINGVEAPVGAAETGVRAGDAVWWDLHRWTGRVHVPVVVGEWPRPLTRGLGGPTGAVSADAPLADALRAAGAAVAEPATAAGPRAVVGAARALARRDPLWARAVADPHASGLTAWIDASGAALVWNARAGRAEPVPAAVAVIVATTDGFAPDDPPVVFVAGATAGAADAGARALAADPTLVRASAAVCLDAAARVVCRGGIGVVP